jgi:hypothetical protein
MCRGAKLTEPAPRRPAPSPAVHTVDPTPPRSLGGGNAMIEKVTAFLR